MPGRKVPKVAYAVFAGRHPGVYDTWSEAEKEVSGFSRAKVKGYTAEDGGRARAETDLREYGGQMEFTDQDTARYARRIEEGNTTPKSPTETIRICVSGRMAESSMSDSRLAQQLPTPPSTWTGKKKERPLSWEAENEVRRKAVCVDSGGTSGGTTSLKPEHTSVHTTYDAALLSPTSSCDADVCGEEESSPAREVAIHLEHGHTTSDKAGFDEPTSSDTRSASTASNEISSIDSTAEKAESSGLVLVAPDSKGTALFSNHASEDNIAPKETSSQMPTGKASGCAGLSDLEVVDPFNTALDYIALGTPSDCGDSVLDGAALDHVSAIEPRLKPRLCDEQLALVKLIMEGKNVFYTGSAGCGKSTVLKHFVTLLRREGKYVDIVAPTGRAALEVNGRTLHNYAGWVPRSLAQPLHVLAGNARGKKVWKRLRATEVLIIDEISMVSNHLFERLNCIMKSARDSKEAFGGVQVVVTGDFLQLPPVNGFEYCLRCGNTLQKDFQNGEYECDKCSALFQEVDKWAFCSTSWQECNFEHVSLRVVHRQRDADFKALLEKCRLGIPYSFDEKWLLLHHDSKTRDAVRLFPMRKDVKAINDEEFAKLPGRSLTYLCVDHFYSDSKQDRFENRGTRCAEPMGHALEALKEHSFEPKLLLKEGMLVILLVNWDLDSGLANGSQGTIVGFEAHNPSLFPEVPRKWEHSSLKNALVKRFVNRTAVQEWPIVQFLNGTRRTIYPRCMVNELRDEESYSLLSRTQIPLMAAWAMTIHRAQGMTLSRAIVDLRNAFEPGHDYVALSRVQTLEGLKVEGLPKNARGPDKQVINFMMKNMMIEKKLMPAVYWYESNNTASEED